jgi:hypothetical protein
MLDRHARELFWASSEPLTDGDSFRSIYDVAAVIVARIPYADKLAVLEEILVSDQISQLRLASAVSICFREHFEDEDKIDVAEALSRIIEVFIGLALKSDSDIRAENNRRDETAAKRFRQES